MTDKIHIAMIIRDQITDISYCGAKHSRFYVSENFYLPNKIMCPICVDEWENEDIRMKTPQKIDNKIQN